LSGPISFVPNNNNEKFSNATKKLTSKGYIVINPLELIENESSTWEECMKVDLTEMLKCDAVFVLDGWEKSRGATLEVFLSQKLSIPVFDLNFESINISKTIDWDFLRYKI
jgi:hypothetical protein